MKVLDKVGIGIAVFLLDCLLILIFCNENTYFSMNYFAVISVVTIDLSIFSFFLFVKERKKVKKIEETDLLTGGYSRHGFFLAANQLLTSSKSDIHNYVIVNLNVIDFKAINQKLGEKEADQILVQIYDIFSSHMKGNELLCRSGVDYFLFLLHAESDEMVRDSIEQMVCRAHDINADIKIDFTMGACRFSDQETLQTVVYKATYIMSQRNHVNQCAFYDEDFAKQESEKLELLASFEQSIKNKEFQVYLQPVIPKDSMAPLGAEALVRWNHPQKGLLFPDKFIHLLEKYDKVQQLDLYMFESICQFIEKLISEGKGYPEISVNLSRSHLKEKGLSICKDYYEIKSKYNIPDGIIKLEITENSMFEVEDIELVRHIINVFHAIGLKVGLDDFGFAYSSIELLKDFDIDILKLDRSFFIDENTKSHIIVKRLIELSHDLGMLVVAEGIEEQHQVNKLYSLNCDYIQGYFFSKPLPLEEFEQWVQKEDCFLH